MSLCLACGLCCTGMLFVHVELSAEEAARLAARRLPVHEEGERRKLPQPCAAHDGTCTVYEDRPATCASFRCATLAAVEEGTMSHADAATALTRAKTQAAAVRAQVGGTGPLWNDITSYVEDSAAFRRAHAELLLDIAVLREMLQRIQPRRPNSSG